jgi:tRNA threonylcarbamoyladenosine biosynthesis protein TsaE
MWTVNLEDMAATQALGRALGLVVSGPTLVSLIGDLGAGKTTFAQGVGAGLGLSSAVVSPTFILMAEHVDGRHPLLHCDAYRLKPGEAESIGMDETIEAWPGIVLLEWGDLLPEVFEVPHIRVHLAHTAAGRMASISAMGDCHQVTVDAWRRDFSA